MSRATSLLLVSILPPVFLACTGVIGEPSAGSDREGGPFIDTPGANETLSEGAYGHGPLRRLSREEYRNTVRDLVGIELGSEIELLPGDAATPFDNDATEQGASAALVEGLKAVSDSVAEQLLSDRASLDAIVGCTPSDADDAACFEQFITTFGRRALRRRLTPAEVERFLVFQSLAIGEADFYVGVGLALRTFLQHPELVYRPEIGSSLEGKEGVFRLSGNEVASRLSYFLWGSTPPDWLLDEADADALQTSDQVRGAAERLLEDERARARINRFHAMWFGYDTRGGSPTRDAMRRESDALIERVVFDEQRSWFDLLTFDETFVNAELAEHYGLPAPVDGEGWVAWDAGRGGLLSHGTILAAGAKFGDTSPTVRGAFIRDRFLCQELPPPPPGLMVNIDEPPGDPADCKWERYEDHRSSAGCASCHALVDPIGFGLENYDATGRYREHEPDRPECTIPGDGSVLGGGDFNGPAELGAVLATMPELRRCAVRQLYRLAVGRQDTLRDEATLAILGERFSDHADRLDALILEVVTSQAFRHRLIEEEE